MICCRLRIIQKPACDTARTSPVTLSDNSEPETNSTNAGRWSHQPPAITRMLSHPETLLDAWMGTGKTYMTLSVLRSDLAEGGAALILCPATVIGVWHGEIQKHTSGQFEVIKFKPSWRSKRKAQHAQSQLEHAKKYRKPIILVVNYETAIRDQMLKLLQTTWWQTVVADESHRLKDHSTATSKMASRFQSHSARRIALTGTPMPNNEGDIFGQARFLSNNYFGKYWTPFVKRYGIKNPVIQGKIDKWTNTDEMREIIGQFRHHIPKDVLDLPDKQEIVVSVELSKEGMKAYREMQEDALTTIQQAIDDGQSFEQAIASGETGLVKFLRLMQLAQGYVGTEEGEIVQTCGEKAKHLMELMEQTDEPICVYGWFKQDIALIRQCAEKLGRRFGEISGSRKDLDNGKFPEGIDVMGVQARSGSVGIDLTRSRIGIFLNPGMLSPGEYDQILARQYRPGQTRNVVYYHLRSVSTVDVSMAYARQKKAKNVGQTLNGGEESLMAMAIRDVFEMAEMDCPF
jgi:SNF2 family DNA or RNA helicase